MAGDYFFLALCVVNASDCIMNTFGEHFNICVRKKEKEEKKRNQCQVFIF